MNDTAATTAAATPDEGADKGYIKEQQQRLMRLLLALSGNEIEGLSPGDIAKLNGCHPSHVTRDLTNAHHFGWAEQIPVTGRWRLGPQIVQIAMRHMTALDRAERRLAEIKGRFSRTDSDLPTQEQHLNAAAARYSAPK